MTPISTRIIIPVRIWNPASYLRRCVSYRGSFRYVAQAPFRLEDGFRYGFQCGSRYRYFDQQGVARSMILDNIQWCLGAAVAKSKFVQ